MTEYDIEKRVSEIFKETQLFEIPVRIVAIAQFYGFSVFKTNEMEDNESGLIIISEDIKNKYGTDKVIIFNKKHSVRRNRFTIAHELGHYLLHKKEPEEIYAHRDLGVYNEEERDANSFASALLMPKESVEKIVKELKEEYSDEILEYALVSCIAKKFNVSEQVAEVRLRKLEILL